MLRFTVLNVTLSLTQQKSCLITKKLASRAEGILVVSLGCTPINSQRSLMQQHVKAIHYKDPFKCTHCSDTFIYKKLLQKHKKNIHNSEGKTYKYNCPECSKGTDDKTEYTAHMDRHSNIRHFKCNICDQAFFSQSQLTTHTKSLCVVPTTRMSATTTEQLSVLCVGRL